MLSPKDSIGQASFVESDNLFCTFLIFFPMYSICRTNFGETLKEQLKQSLAET